jgi:hypothetical protein
MACRQGLHEGGLSTNIALNFRETINDQPVGLTMTISPRFPGKKRHRLHASALTKSAHNLS